MRRLFFFVGWFEGLSLLILLFVAMPLKYFWGMPEMVKTIGMAHGILFVIYIVLAGFLFAVEGWPLRKLALAMVLSSVPFGTFVFESKYSRN